MTRINSIHPRTLTNEWVFAEYRELPRIINEMKTYPGRYKPADTPAKYTMGKGHCKFFRNKLLYLKKRHELLAYEVERRGFKTKTPISVTLDDIPTPLYGVLCNDWTPTDDDHHINIQRLMERFYVRGKPYYFGNVKIDDDFTFCRYLSMVYRVNNIKL